MYDYATIATFTAASSVDVLVFRLEREVKGGEQGEGQWMPRGRRLRIGPAVCSVALVFVPALAFNSQKNEALERAACFAFSIGVGGYFFAILAHCRFIGGKKRDRDPKVPRQNPEPAERLCIYVTLAFAAGFIFVFVHR